MVENENTLAFYITKLKNPVLTHAWGLLRSFKNILSLILIKFVNNYNNNIKQKDSTIFN